MTEALRYKRLLLKLSGEAMMGAQGFGIDTAVTERLARDVAEAAAASTGNRSVSTTTEPVNRWDATTAPPGKPPNNPPPKMTASALTSAIAAKASGLPDAAKPIRDSSKINTKSQRSHNSRTAPCPPLALSTKSASVLTDR